jgi:hypothetical protein
VRTSESRRRTAVVTLLALATWALVATSPPQPPSHNVEATDTVALRLTDDAPVSSVAFEVQVSDEALWSDDPEVLPHAATVIVGAGLPRASGVTATQSADSGATPVFGVRLMRDGTEVGSRPDVGTVIPSLVEFDLRTACPEGRDCSVELEAIVEWLNPLADQGLSAELLITATTQIEGPEVVPVGAEVSLTAEEPVAPEVTVLRDAGSAAPVRLDEDRPMATWAVDLEASAGAMAQPLQWPIDPRGVLSIGIDVPGAEPGEYQYGDPAVRLLLIAGGEEVELRPVVGTLQHQLPVFRCQAIGQACQERVTLVARWVGDSPDRAITIGLDLDAGITFHTPAEPDEGAAVTVSDASRTDIHADGPSVRASLNGSIPLVDDESPVLARIIRIDIPASALASDRIGGPVPAVMAIVTASSTSGRPVEEDTEITFRMGEANMLVPLPFQPSATGVAWAAPECRVDARCTADFGIFSRAYRRDGGLEGTELTTHWTVEIVLIYPDGVSPPPGAVIDLRHGLP